MLLSSQKWRRQPTAPVKVNPGHWAAHALLASFVPYADVPLDLVTRRSWSRNGSPSLVPASGRWPSRAVSFPGDGAGTELHWYGHPAFNPTKIIIVSRVTLHSPAGEDGHIVGREFASSNVPYTLTPKRADATVIQGMSFYDGAWRQSGVTTDINNTGWRDVAGTYDGATLAYYVDGRLDASASYSGTLPSNTSDVFVGKYRTERGFDGEIEYVHFLDANKLNPSVALVKELQDEPYALFVPVTRRLYFATAAGGAPYVAEFTAASFGFTPQAVTRFNDWIAALTAASFAFVANAINQITEYTAALTAASFNFTANALTRLNAYVAELTAPAFNFTAQMLTYTAGGVVEIAKQVGGFIVNLCRGMNR